MSVLFVSFKFLYKFEQFLTSSFLKDTHQVRGKSLLVVARNFLYGAARWGKIASFGPLINKRAINTFPVEISTYLSFQHHFNKLAVCHHKFWNKVNIPVSVVAKLIWNIFIWSENLPGLCHIERSSWVSIIWVLV